MGKTFNPRHLPRVAVILLTLLISDPALAWTANRDDRSNGEAVAQLIEDQLLARSGGDVHGNEIHYPEGDTFVAVEAGVPSLAQCTSGRFCGWAQSYYAGSFYYTTGTATTTGLDWTARSYSNNRGHGARLYDSSGSASLCFMPGQDRPTIGSSYYVPAKVYMSGTTSC